MQQRFTNNQTSSKDDENKNHRVTFVCNKTIYYTHNRYICIIKLMDDYKKNINYLYTVKEKVIKLRIRS